MRTLTVLTLLILVHTGVKSQNFNIVKNPICISDTATFRYNSLNLTSVLWNYPAGTNIITSSINGTGNQQVTFDTPGSYIIPIVATINGTPRNDTLVIEVSQLLNSYVDKKVEFLPTASYILTMSANINNSLSLPPHTFRWTIGNDTSALPPGNSQYTYKFTKTGEKKVELKVTDAGGCAVKYDTTVTSVELFTAPNVFTPNNDGTNDTFIVSSTGLIPFTIEIFDRSGSIVYKPDLVLTQLSWDGRNSAGIVVKPGVYFYVITPEDNSLEPLKGFVHIYHDKK